MAAVKKPAKKVPAKKAPPKAAAKKKPAPPAAPAKKKPAPAPVKEAALKGLKKGLLILETKPEPKIVIGTLVTGKGIKPGTKIVAASTPVSGRVLRAKAAAAAEEEEGKPPQAGPLVSNVQEAQPEPSPGRRVNLKQDALRAVQSHESRVAFAYYRGTSKVRYISFGGEGPSSFEMGASAFDELFDRHCNQTPFECALSFAKSLRGAYTFDEVAAQAIAELCEVAAFGERGIQGANAAGLHFYCGRLAKAMGLGVASVAKFKTDQTARAEAIALHAQLLAPSSAQVKRRAEDRIAAAQRLGSLVDRAKDSPAAENKPAKAPAKPATARKAAGAATGSAPRGKGIGAFCYDLLRAGKSNDEVLAAVQKQFPDATTKMASIAWYRNKLKQEGA